MLSEQALGEMAEVLERYPRKQAAILPIFHLVQREHGYVSAEAEEWIAGQLGMAPVKVHEVLTFYTMLHLKPVNCCNGGSTNGSAMTDRRVICSVGASCDRF